MNINNSTFLIQNSENLGKLNKICNLPLDTIKTIGAITNPLQVVVISHPVVSCLIFGGLFVGIGLLTYKLGHFSTDSHLPLKTYIDGRLLQEVFGAYNKSPIYQTSVRIREQMGLYGTPVNIKRVLGEFAISYYKTFYFGGITRLTTLLACLENHTY